MWRLLIIVCTMFISSSCGMGSRKDAKSDVHKTVIFRYDKLLNDYVAYNSFSALQRLSGEYRLHTRILIEDVLRIGSFEDDDSYLKLQAIYSDSVLRRLTEDVFSRYEKMDELEKKFTKAFSRMKKELPEVKTPLLYAQISALNQPIVVSDSLIGISLDDYLGSDYPVYTRFFLDYQRAGMRPERIVPDAVKFYLMSVFPFPAKESPSMINRMIYLGKLFYVTSELLNISPAEVMLDYSPESRKWCEENKAAVWTYMQNQGHLLSEEVYIQSRYLNIGPCTEPFGTQSPHRIGLWLGIQIADSYMKKHPDTSYSDLLSRSAYVKFLSDSGFGI